MSAAPEVGSWWKARPNAPKWCSRTPIQVQMVGESSVVFLKDPHTLTSYTKDAFLRDYAPASAKETTK